MAHARWPSALPDSPDARPYWSQVLRALREARGMTQDGWAMQLGYGRSTVKRWETGEAVPAADAEAALLALCHERSLFRTFAHGPLAGVCLTPEWLSGLLAEARLGFASPLTSSLTTTAPVAAASMLGPSTSPQEGARSAGNAANATAWTPPETAYARSGDLYIAYQVMGDGPVDLVMTPGFLSQEIRRFIAAIEPAEEIEQVLATALAVGGAVPAARRTDFDAIVEREVGRYRGRPASTSEVGTLATFDGPVRAIRCGSAILIGARGLGIEARAGLHTGACEVVGDRVGGPTARVAERLAHMATSGEILLTSGVEDLIAGSGIVVVDRGTRPLDGIPGEWRLFAVQ